MSQNAPFSGKLNLRLGHDLHARVAALAAQSGMSINSWIKETLEREVGVAAERGRS